MEKTINEEGEFVKVYKELIMRRLLIFLVLLPSLAVSAQNMVAPAGYEFAGWYTAASGGTKIGDGEASYTPTASSTMRSWRST